MRRNVWMVVGLLLGWCCSGSHGAELSLSSGGLSARVSTHGGALVSFALNGKDLTCPVREGKALYSFTEQALRQEGMRAVMEDFGRLTFTPVASGGYFASMTACGTGNFDWLRITKTYTLRGKAPSLTVTWKLENISQKARSVGFWHRTFLRRHQGAGVKNTFYIPRQGRVEILTHPGDSIGELWVHQPDRAFMAYAGEDDGMGGILLLPRELTTAFYCWLSKTKLASTLEWFSREVRVEPGKPSQFSVEVLACAQEVGKAIQAPEIAGRTLQPGTGQASLLPRLYGKGEKGLTVDRGSGGVMPVSTHYLDIHGKRQYAASVRGVLLPSSLDVGSLSVYELKNGKPELDRPVPFKLVSLPTGERRLLLHVRGINPDGYYFTKLSDGLAFDRRRRDRFVSESEFSYRVCFDLPGVPASDPSLFGSGADLVWNGDFERRASFGEWPEGYFWSWSVRQRKLFSWVGDGVSGSRCIRVTKEIGSKDWAIFPIFLRLEEGLKYRVSYEVRAENAPRRSIYTQIDYMDSHQKTIWKHRRKLFASKDSFGWHRVEETVYAPPGMAFGKLQFGVERPGQTLWVDSVRVVPEDFRYESIPPVERLREEVKSSRYGCLDFIETLKDEVETPHEPWLLQAVDSMPEILYLPLGAAGPHVTEFTARREILEIAQRMKVRYRYIPLLVQLTQPNGYHVDYGHALEPYTLLRLDEVKKAPRVVMVQSIDFKEHVQQAFVDRLLAFRQGGSNFLFYNCRNVPVSLLGERTENPEGIFATPRFRTVSPARLSQGFSSYRDGERWSLCMTCRSQERRVDAHLFECVPPSQVRETYPAYCSRDFPYWEYMQLSLLKSLRHLAGIRPQAQVVGNLERGIRVKAARDMTVVLKAVYHDMNRGIDGEKTVPIHLNKGMNAVELPLPPLPGGQHVVHYWLTDEQGSVHDCGALTFATAERVGITVDWGRADKVYERGQAVELGIRLGTVPQGGELEVEVEDVNGRVVVRKRSSASAEQRVSFTVLPPYTTLYRLFVRVRVGGQVVSRLMEEFSMPSGGKDLYQLDAAIWCGWNPMHQVHRDLGFTMSVQYTGLGSGQNGIFRSLRNLDLEPLSFGLGHVNRGGSNSLVYRGDKESDPVRKPCYSDPAYWEEARQRLAERVTKDQYRYYGIRHFYTLDEAFIGRSVCYSSHCLKGLREELRKQYGSLEALNREWGSGFDSWDKVMPKQLKELKSRDNLAPWLDHKMFMAKMAAHGWVGGVKACLQQHIPHARVGLSGTQVPGYGYDWVQLMKHIDCLGYYSGIQRKAVHDFRPSGLVSGLWGGGYIRAELENEFYEKSMLWDDVLLGANLANNFSSYGFRGDLSPVQNTVYYSELLKELRRGPARLVLHASEIVRDVAVLYSQASLYAAMGGIGGSVWQNSQTGWSALLDDLQYSYRWMSYEDLDRTVPREKVVILPASLALSERSVANLRRFVSAGGLVLSDMGAGIYSEHGRRLGHSSAEKLFGISRAGGALSVVNRPMEVVSSSSDGVPGFSGQFQLGESGLVSSGATVHGSSGKGNGVFFVHRVGKGKAVLLNIPMGAYQKLAMGGVGGESASTQSGTQQFCQVMREAVGRQLAGVHTRRSSQIVEAASGKPYACRASLRQDGVNLVYVIHKSCTVAPDGVYPMRFHPRFRHNLAVTLPVGGHVYDVRKRQYLGKRDRFPVSLHPGDGQIFTVLQKRVRGVTVSAPEAVRGGEPLTVSFKAEGGTGPHVFQLDMVNPQGKRVDLYAQNVRGEQAEGTLKFQMACNDQKGIWTIRVTNVNTGMQGERSIRVD